MSNRHLARTIAMQSLFEWDFAGQQESLDSCMARNAEHLAARGEDQDFARELVRGVAENLEKIDAQIAATAPAWPLQQLASVDRAVLRLALYELVVAKDVPPRVVIDEAVELAKTFGGENSSKFVNGVLGTLYKQAEAPETRG